MKPKIVILRGMPTAGKSTTYQNLKPKLKNYVFVDHAFLKHMLSDVKGGKKIAKKLLFEAMKEVMKQKRSIIIEEMSPQAVRRYLNYYIKRYNYGIISFRFVVSLEAAFKRDVLRKKTTMGKQWIKKAQKNWIEEKAEEGEILVDTTRLSQKQTVSLIFRHLKRK